MFLPLFLDLKRQRKVKEKKIKTFNNIKFAIILNAHKLFKTKTLFVILNNKKVKQYKTADD